MPVHNSDVAETFEHVADLLAVKGANQFRVRAYRDAARTVSGLSGDVAEMIEEGEDFSEYSGIGDDLAGKIEEVVEAGSLSMIEELHHEVPPGVADMLKLPGIGPKKAATLYHELEVTTLAELGEAAESGEVAELEGFGEKTQEKIAAELKRLEERGEKRWPWNRAEEYALPLVEYLRDLDGTGEVIVAGSFRRREETVGDLDMLATCEDSDLIMDAFVDYEDVEEVVSKGSTRSSVRLRRGLQVDLRAVDVDSFGAALHYFTGSKAHNIAIRRRGQDRGLKINEYGVFDGDDQIGGATEKEVFEAVDLKWMEPELRTDRGEIEAAEEGELPELIDYDELRGDLHMHTEATDGRNTMREMAETARELGRDYVAITDHSKNVSMANGLDADRLAEQIDAVDRLDDELDGIKILKGIEVDILEDGSLDLPDDILARLDVRVCSVHYQTGLSREKMTERILRAMDNPHFDILGHPTGRLIQRRDPYEVDLERVFEKAADRGCVLEINAQPDRLDLNDIYARKAREMGAKLVISTDAHSTAELENLEYGIAQGRRGWLEADDVINTRSVDELLNLLD